MKNQTPKKEQPDQEVSMSPSPATCCGTVAPPTKFQELLMKRGHLNDMIHTVERYEERKARIIQILEITNNLITDLKNANVPYVESSQAECYLRNSTLWLKECLLRLDTEIEQHLESQK